jgi:hypothetical protein
MGVQRAQSQREQADRQLHVQQLLRPSAGFDPADWDVAVAASDKLSL